MTGSATDQHDDLYPFDRFGLKGHSDIIDHILLPTNRSHPSWILAGPEGIGKATAALHLAARLLSHQSDPLFDDDAGATIGPSKEQVRRLIRAGSHPDLKIIRHGEDAGRKTISIDQIREMTSFLSMTPSMGDWRVVIIDALDNIGVNGANAMLKTLEEPPKNSMIVIISHAPGSILPTIRSRSRLIRFDLLHDQDSREVISQLYPDIDPEWMDIMVHIADGAPGRACMAAETGSIELYAETLNALTLPSCDKVLAERLAGQWGAAGIRNRDRRHMTMLMFERIIRLAANQASGSHSPSSLALEQSAINHLAARHSANHLAQWHQDFLRDWRRTESLNLAMAPLVLRLLVQLSQG